MAHVGLAAKVWTLLLRDLLNFNVLLGSESFCASQVFHHKEEKWSHTFKIPKGRAVLHTCRSFEVV